MGETARDVETITSEILAALAGLAVRLDAMSGELAEMRARLPDTYPRAELAGEVPVSTACYLHGDLGYLASAVDELAVEVRQAAEHNAAWALQDEEPARRPQGAAPRPAVAEGWQGYYAAVTAWLSRQEMTQKELAGAVEAPPSTLSSTLRGVGSRQSEGQRRILAKVAELTGIRPPATKGRQAKKSRR